MTDYCPNCGEKDDPVIGLIHLPGCQITPPVPSAAPEGEPIATRDGAAAVGEPKVLMWLRAQHPSATLDVSGQRVNMRNPRVGDLLDHLDTLTAERDRAVRQRDEALEKLEPTSARKALKYITTYLPPQVPDSEDIGLTVADAFELDAVFGQLEKRAVAAEQQLASARSRALGLLETLKLTEARNDAAREAVAKVKALPKYEWDENDEAYEVGEYGSVFLVADVLAALDGAE